MATSFDCRKDIRETIGTLKAINNDDWEEQYVISVTADGMDYDIPIYLSEESASLEEPPFPFIDLNIMNVTYEPHDVGALTRKMESFIDVGFWFTANDEYDPSTFGKAVMDELQDVIRTQQESCNFQAHFVNVRSVKLRRDGSGKQAIYHYVIEIYAIYYSL